MSYKSDGADEDFVLHKLQPVLEEQLGFRLCLHYRDFVIGAGEYTPVGGLVKGGGGRDPRFTPVRRLLRGSSRTLYSFRNLYYIRLE